MAATDEMATTRLTLEELQETFDFIRGCSDRTYKRTPLLSHWKDTGDCAELSRQCHLYLKLENMQTTGSYKVRGILNQLRHFRQSHVAPTERPLVTLSAGNYGKAFAYLTSEFRHRLVLMPTTAPDNRQKVIESYGAMVERVTPSEALMRIQQLTSGPEAMSELPSIECLHLIEGHASLGLEILEDLEDPDVILVPCGGGALLAGVAAAVKLSGLRQCRIYGVEPQGANTMYQSMRKGEALTIETARSIASGLAPPFVGHHAYRLCSQYVEDVIVVPEESIGRALIQLYRQGLVVEPSGAVGYAALALGLVPDVQGRRVVVVISGGNVSVDDLADIGQRT